MTSLEDETGFPTNITLLNTEGYKWDNFVVRDLTDEERIAHDVFGCFPTLETSERSPYVGIELIGDKYPDDFILDGMIHSTNNMPYFIFLEFMKAPNRLFVMDKAGRTIKPTYFIYDGSVWRNCKRINNITANKLKRMVRDDLVMCR